MSDQEAVGPTGQSTSDSSPIQRRHGTEVLRGLQEVARSSLYEGRFGRMFRNLPPLLPDDNDLIQLANTMLEPADTADDQESASPFDNSSIPAGFTYLGQFIDHDITFDPTSKLQRQNDPNALRNFRTPRYDLDSVYASGPDDAPYMYQDDGIHFLLGKDRNGEDDLPRNTPVEREPRRALIGDPRNDENVIVSQIQLAFLKFHNNVVDAIADSCPHDQIFDEARRIVRWHYQWVVVHDFVKTIVGEDLLNDVLTQDTFVISSTTGTHSAAVPKLNLKFFHWKNQPFMPVEFSAAAYRFGHSLVRPEYDLNTRVVNIPIFSPNDNAGEFEDLRGFRERPPFWVIEWRCFFPFPDSGSDLQFARKVDTKLSPGLGKLPTNVDLLRRSLAVRNLLRGKALELPSGQAIARATGIPESMILTGDALGFNDANLTSKFGDNTPLWYYILKDSEVHAEAKHLGPVDGRIVAEALLGLLHGDPFSYLNVEPNWKPEPGLFGAGDDGTFSMTELLQFARSKDSALPPPPPPTTGLHVGGNATVSDILRLRATPGINGKILDQLQPHTTVSLIGGPTQADNHTWWQVQVTPARKGWAAQDGLQPA